MQLTVLVTETIERVAEFDVVVDDAKVLKYHGLDSMPSNRTEREDLFQDYLAYHWDSEFAGKVNPRPVDMDGVIGVSVGEVTFR